MRSRYGDVDYEIPDEWLAEAGMMGFTVSAAAYRHGPSPFPELPTVTAVALADIEPLRRSLSHGVFNDSQDATARERVVQILRGFRQGSKIPPVEICRMDASASHPFRLKHGVHRFYCSHAVGFSQIPAVEVEDYFADLRHATVQASTDSVLGLKRAQLAHVRQWIDMSRTMAREIPAAERLAENLQWEVESLGNLPSTGEAVVCGGYSLRDARQSLWQTQQALPLVANFDRFSIYRANSITTSSGTTVASQMFELSLSTDAPAAAYAALALQRYAELSSQQQRERDVRALIVELFPTLVARYETALHGVETWRADGMFYPNAAGPVRTYLDGLKGACQQVLRAPSEQTRKLRWEEMAGRLGLGPSSIVSLAGDTTNSLTETFKDLPERSTDIEHSWRQVLDISYVVLNAVKARRLEAP